MTTNDLLEILWERTKKVALTSPYCFTSQYYAHKGAAEEVAKTILLPEDKERFLAYAHEQYQSYSNYSGD